MRILLSLALVVGVMAVLSNTSNAQVGYHQGYGFGAGYNNSNFLGGGCCTTPREQPPYFAKFPPVYYSGIVRRPYGVSPYAAPAGITPVEMTVPVPMSIKNPFYENEVVPVSNEVPVLDPPVIDGNGNKVTWFPNPYIESVVNN